MKKYLFILLCVISFGALADQKSLSFLVLTDIHFTPFTACEGVKQKPCPLIAKLRLADASNWHAILEKYDTAMPTYRRNTNFTLLSSSLKNAADNAKKEDAQFVLVLGDNAAHRFRHNYKNYSLDDSRAGYEAFVEKTLNFVASEIGKSFPGLDVYMVAGNNDSFHRDYYVNPNGAFFREMAGPWSYLIKNKTNREIMRKEFSRLGYYAVDIPNYPHLRLIVLNTVIFSNKANGVNVAGSAEKQLTWLHNQLLDARKNNDRVIIAMHIPDAIDIYTSMRVRLLRAAELWQPEYSDKFREELKNFAPEIAGLYAGHLHANWMHMLRFEKLVDVPFIGTASISPIYGNNPGFRIYRYGLKGYELEDFIEYKASLGDEISWESS